MMDLRKRFLTLGDYLMSEFKLRTPVIFIIFNRPDTTKIVFDEIRRVRPPKLLVIADGARTGRYKEQELVDQTRSILEAIDWDCELFTEYSDVNLGCRNRLSTGLTWAFQHVSEAIILEDDCVPDPSFFEFCQELLSYYQSDQRISMISGANLLLGNSPSEDSYYFSNNSHIWGWATWADRWLQDYDPQMVLWPMIRDGNYVADWANSKTEQMSLIKVFEKTYKGEIDTWDHQWNFANRLNGRISIIPSKNLISNIGFREDATHTKKTHKLANMMRAQMAFPLKHPKYIFASRKTDELFHKNIEKRQSKTKKLTNTISKLFAINKL